MCVYVCMYVYVCMCVWWCVRLGRRDCQLPVGGVGGVLSLSIAVFLIYVYICMCVCVCVGIRHPLEMVEYFVLDMSTTYTDRAIRAAFAAGGGVLSHRSVQDMLFHVCKCEVSLSLSLSVMRLLYLNALRGWGYVRLSTR